MRSPDVVGKRIKQIIQVRVRSECGDVHHHLAAIVFDDGSRLCFNTVETRSFGNGLETAVEGEFWPATAPLNQGEG